jgi:hypothetical protein
MKIRLKIIENMQCVEFHIQILGEEHIRREIQVLFVFLMDFFFFNRDFFFLKKKKKKLHFWCCGCLFLMEGLRRPKRFPSRPLLFLLSDDKRTNHKQLPFKTRSSSAYIKPFSLSLSLSRSACVKMSLAIHKGLHGGFIQNMYDEVTRFSPPQPRSFLSIF